MATVANGKPQLSRPDLPKAALNMQKREVKSEPLKRRAPESAAAQKRPRVESSSNFLADLYAGLPPPDPTKDAAAKERASKTEDRTIRMPPIDRSKVVFLDVDGVLRPLKAGGFAAYQFGDGEAAITCDTSDFIQAALEALRHIVVSTGALLVLSSEWRRSQVMREGLDAILTENHMHTCVGATTTAIDRELGSGDPLTAFRKRRVKELDDWLNKNPQIKQWVAVDDLDLSVGDEDRGPGDWRVVDHFVQTNDQVGLTRRGAEAAVKILNGEKLPPQVLKVQPQRELF